MGPSAAARSGWRSSAASRTDFGSCRLGNCAYGKLPLGKIPLGKYLISCKLRFISSTGPTFNKLEQDLKLQNWTNSILVKFNCLSYFLKKLNLKELKTHNFNNYDCFQYSANRPSVHLVPGGVLRVHTLSSHFQNKQDIEVVYFIIFRINMILRLYIL